jgi:hypothetical protein
MTAPLLKALASGYTSKQIVDFLIRKFPQHASKIQAAVAMGYGPDKIIRYLTGGRKGVNGNDNFSEGIQTEHTQTREADINRRQNVNNAALAGAGLAATGLGAYALSRSLPQAAQAAFGISPGPGTPPPQPPTGTPPRPGTPPMQPATGIQVQPQSPVPPPGPPPGPSPQPTQIQVQKQPLQIGQQPSQPVQPVQPVVEEAENLFEMIKAGKTPKGEKPTNFMKFAKYLMSKGDISDPETLNNFQKWWQSTEGQKRGSPLREFEKFRFEANWLPHSKENKKETPLKKEPELPIEIEKPKVEEKGLAALPSGQIGQIESVKNGIAKVNVDGQIKHRKLSELIQEPEEIRNAIQDILQIPESERSAVFDFVNYDSKDKRLYVQFPTGKTVVYLDVDPSHAGAIRESKGVPKTSGETKTGERWMAGVPDSRGAEFFARIKADPKYSKANEGKTWYYLEDVYDKYGKLRLKPKRKKKRQ